MRLEPSRFFHTWSDTEGTFLLMRILTVALAFLLSTAGAVLIGATQFGVFAVLGVISVAVALVIALRPEHGIMVLVIFVYSNMSVILEDAFGVPDANKFLVALIFLGLIGSRVFIKRQALIFRLTETAMLFVGISTIVSLFLSKYQWDAVYLTTNWAKDFIIALILVQVSGEEKVYKRAIWAVVLTATFLSILGIYQSISGDYSNDFYGLAKAPIHEITAGNDSQRITGPLDDPNFYGMILLSILPSAVYRALDSKTFNAKLLGGFCSFVILLTVMFTYSRGAFMSMLITMILVAVERRMNPYKLVATVAIVFMALSPILPASFWERLDTLTMLFGGSEKGQTEVSFRGRSSEMIVAVQMFYDYPFSGVGKGNYIHNYQDYSGRLGLDTRIEGRQAHSLYLELAAEQGVIGLISFFFMISTLFLGMYRTREIFRHVGREDLTSWVMGIQIGLTGYLVSSIFLHGDYARYMWLLIAFGAAGISLADEKMFLFRQSQNANRDEALLTIRETNAPTKLSTADLI